MMPKQENNLPQNKIFPLFTDSLYEFTSIYRLSFLSNLERWCSQYGFLLLYRIRPSP